MQTTTDENEAILSVRNLKTYFQTDIGTARAVDGISFEIRPGKTLALVGESGCGKSVTALSIIGLIPTPPGSIEGDGIYFRGQNMLELNEPAMRGIRGNDISMIFQEPMTSLNPVFRIGGQIAAVLRLHRGLSKEDARAATIDLLDQVGIPSPEIRVDDYPHQMSGGMRQRVMIAMALACDPEVLIADEPTTALDVTIQAQILDLLRGLQESRNMSILLITHDLGVVAEMAHEVAIMYAGEIREHGSVEDIFHDPGHPYTVGLFKSLPQHAKQGERLHSIKGQVPAATQFPEACRFAPRCPHAMDICTEKTPPFFHQTPRHKAACWLHDTDVMAAQGLSPGLPAEARL